MILRSFTKKNRGAQYHRASGRRSDAHQPDRGRHKRIELRQIMLTASGQKRHMIPLNWEDSDCPELWGEGEDTAACHWYEESGQ